MRIVHVTHRAWPAIGGSERYVHEIARRQSTDGHQVTIVATDALDLRALWDTRAARVGSDAPAELDGVRIERLPVRYLPAGGLTFPALRRVSGWVGRVWPGLALRSARFSPWLPSLPHVLARCQADLFFAWHITLEGLTLAVADEARRRSVAWVAVPLVHIARPGQYALPHQIALLKRADCILAQTEIERQFLVAQGCGAERTRLVSPGVDLDEARTGQGRRFRARWGLPDDTPLVLALGPLCYDKGTPYVLDALRLLWAEGVRVALALVGPPQGSVRFSPRRAVARLPAAECADCLVTGEVTEGEKWDALDAATVVMLPSRVESFGITYLEAWACRKPVIGARAGAVPGVIEDGRDGLLVRFGDSRALAAALRRLLGDPALADELGRRGREKVERLYRWERQYARLRSVVEELIHSRGASSHVSG